MPKVGRMKRWVALSRSTTTLNDADGNFEPLSPAGWWAQILPLPPVEGDHTILHDVRMRYHAQVDVHTRLTYTLNGTARELFVKSYQNLDEDGAELRLLCEEIVR